GNVAENSGGPHCFKYGVTTNYVIGMDVVLADGRLVRVGGHALDYPEYDLCGLITGSEGMLAFMTEITVRLLRNPPDVKTMLVVFDSVEQAGTAVSAVIATGLVPATMEMMDQRIIGIIEPFAHAGLPTDAGAVLIIEVDGYPASLEAQIAEIASIMQTHGGRGLRIAANEEERNAIWFARKSAAGAITRLCPSYYTVDITVPRSRLAEMLGKVNQLLDRRELRAGHVFHAGDGNLHPLIMIPHPEDHELIQRVHDASWEMVSICVGMGGSLSGEHGVGIEKRAYMPLMHTPDELVTMLDIKYAFDPTNLLNPGKIFPTPAQNEQDNRLSSTAPLTLPTLTNSVFAPTTAEEAAQGLQACSNARQSVFVRGTMGNEARAIPEKGVILSTANLRGITHYAADDLYITAGAGTPLAEIQAFLADERKQVPLADPWSDMTIGGLVAANINAPQRMRYGSVRDIVLCGTVALADGRLVRVGRPVIKNVAGYDLTKVFVGSYGTLGLLTDITLKVVAQPRARRTLLVPFEDLRHGLRYARSLLPLALIASALVLCKDCPVPGMPQAPYTLVYTAEGMPEDVQAEFAQVRQALQTVQAPTPVEIDTLSGTDIWAALLGGTQSKVQVRVGIPARDMPAYINDLATVLQRGTFLADTGNGLLYATMNTNDVAETLSWVEQLRNPALALEGYAVVMTMPDAWNGVIDRWGYQPQALDVMRRLKRRWDPAGILNPEVFITG
ncbi:MAG TPA: FAD-linked oxidase C-terminal domain-containing protein, partial [Ktedonobacteraceae bacterium]|nr:FAD-linked oxidase C-terminal domain-containing protein [Ktedonobacteraceae bacterium]